MRGMPIIDHMPVQYPNGGGRMDIGRGGGPDYRGGGDYVGGGGGGGGMIMNGHGRGGYPLVPSGGGSARTRSGDRERDRER